ncbi:phage tail protein [Yersinia intermedia]|uniref:phage tail protein n=1 Tax=Yersinia intermedia TaxID=631 RepID=UPI0021BD54CA|nr:phage tail protein [Yersinia intermedia]
MSNQILPFGIGAGANVIPYADYEALPARTGGFVSGVARSEQLNTVWRQSSFMASVLADFIAKQSGNDVLDDGNTAVLLANLELAIKTYIGNNLPSASLTQKGAVQLSSSTTSTSETLAATPKAVKTVNDAALKIANNLSDLTNVQTALTNLTLTGIGIGLPTQPTIANFDFQTAVFTSGANYAVSSSTWLNVPVEVVYPTGIIISITVISVPGSNVILKLVPHVSSAGKYNTYYVRMSGAAGSRTIYVIQDWNSASPIPITGGGTGAIDAAGGRTNLGLGTAAVANIGTGTGQVLSMASFTSGPGWMKFPDGTIIQFGTNISGSAGYPTSVNFPIPFTADFRVTCSFDSPTSPADCPAFSTSKIGNTGFYLASSRQGSVTGAGAHWIAIGK